MSIGEPAWALTAPHSSGATGPTRIVFGLDAARRGDARRSTDDAPGKKDA
jgi:hypothetical protein